ncbi:hypothetical protein ACFYNW_35185 [Streptomyces virginiae]|uniref:hypothetical protein n=1 Tax=Streptomyces virginiae TaxID=1961 RepID=UPI0036EB1E87
MRIENVVGIQAVRLAVTVGAVAAAPVLLVAGAPVLRRILRRYYLEDGSGLVSKEDGWVSPAYFVATNAVVRALCWPSDYVLRNQYRGGGLLLRPADLDVRQLRAHRPEGQDIQPVTDDVE